MDIYRKKLNNLTLPVGGEVRVGVISGAKYNNGILVSDVARLLEFGNYKVKEYSFMRKGNREFVKKLNKIDPSFLFNLNKIAIFWEGEIKQSIDNLGTITLPSGGVKKILVDTGKLRSSLIGVAYENKNT